MAIAWAFNEQGALFNAPAVIGINALTITEFTSPVSSLIPVFVGADNVTEFTFTPMSDNGLQVDGNGDLLLDSNSIASIEFSTCFGTLSTTGENAFIVGSSVFVKLGAIDGLGDQALRITLVLENGSKIVIAGANLSYSPTVVFYPACG